MASVGDVASRERRLLCDLFEEVGPDAPTLCGDWTTADLAAHLVVRDRELIGASGIVLPGPFAALTERRMEAVRRRGFPTVVSTIRKGPALWWKLAPAGTNLNEFFVHHEDVRRAQPDSEPRPADDERDAALWEVVSGAGKLFARRAPVGLVVETPDGRTATLRKRDTSVTVTGRAGELLLFLNGRAAVARVDLHGSDEAVAELRAADFGV